MRKNIEASQAVRLRYIFMSYLTPPVVKPCILFAFVVPSRVRATTKRGADAASVHFLTAALPGGRTATDAFAVCGSTGPTQGAGCATRGCVRQLV